MKTCVLFSGGWDSMAAALIYKKEQPELLFINYGQFYSRNEFIAANNFAKKHKLGLMVHELSLKHDIERRNFYLILEAKKLGYEKIITGNRNLLPMFDKYKDSNWFNLKILAWISGVKLRLPTLLWTKKRIVNYVLKQHKEGGYNCYENKKDCLSCCCANCLELRKILYESK